MIEKEIECKDKGKEPRWHTVVAGTFDTCYNTIREEGYIVESRVDKGLLLHIPSQTKWATLTGNHVKDWVLVKYNYRPLPNEPSF